MKEAGIDISRQTSNNITEYRNINFDYVLTVCDNAKEQCPVFPSNAKVFHHNFTDPAKATGSEKEIMQQFAMVREEIGQYADNFIKRIFLNH